MSRNYTTLAGLLLFALCLACAAQSPVQFGFGSSDLSPVKFGGKKLPSWLSSDYAPIFNGVNQYAVSTLASANTGNWTVMCWQKPYQSVANARIWSARGSGFGTDIYLGSAYALTLYTESGPKVWAPGITIASNTWSHLAIVKSGTTMSAVVGGLLATYTTVNATAGLDTSFTFQRYSGSSYAGTFGNSAMAELSIWNRALNQSEILRYKDKRLKGTESGLVAYYPLNDNSQTLIDKVGGKNAIASNTIQWTRRNGYAAPDVRSERFVYQLDAADNYASAATTISTYPYTFECWYQLPVLTSGQQSGVVTISSASVDAGAHRVSIFNSGGSTYLIRYLKSNSSIIAYSAGFAAATRWVHLAAVAEAANSSKLYVDGVLVGSETTNIPYGGPSMTHQFLGALPGASTPGRTAICEVRFWNVARTQAEIQANMYSMLTPPIAGLVHYYKCIEGTGASLTDLGSGNKPMTLYLGSDWKGRDIP